MPLSLGLGTLLGNLGSGLLGGVASVFGASSTNRANERIAADNRAMQIAENEKSREHNLMLAKMQNKWNLEQYQRERQDTLADWNRENVYNSPAAQMQRYMAAGLNPNLIYNQSNTSGSLSSPSIAGSMTSGAPSTPAALTPTPPRQNPYAGLQPMFEKIGDALMNIPIYKEQVRGAKLDNDLKEEELDVKRQERSVREFLDSIFVNSKDGTDDPDFKDVFNQPLSLYELRALNEVRLQNEQLKEIEGRNKLFDRNFDNMVREVANRAEISEKEAEFYLRTFYGRVASTNERNALESLDDLPEWGKKGVRILRIIGDTVGRIFK